MLPQKGMLGFSLSFIILASACGQAAGTKPLEEVKTSETIQPTLSVEAPTRATSPEKVTTSAGTTPSAGTTTTPVVQDVEPTPVPKVPIVKTVLETEPLLNAKKLPDGSRVGEANDIAVWIHPTDPTLSVVVGAVEKGGLEIYDLEGKALQSIKPNDEVRYNQVDIAYNFPLNGATVDLVVIADRKKDALAIFKIDPDTRQLEDVTDPASSLIFTPAEVTVYRSPKSNAFYAFVNRRKTGTVVQLELRDVGDGKVGWQTGWSFDIATPEGVEKEDAQIQSLVVDSELGALYIAQEEVGLWKYPAESESSTQGQLIHKIDPENGYLKSDIEGLTIYYAADGKGYIIVSSQDDSTFAVFARDGDNQYLGSFQTGVNGDVDAVQESTGAQVSNISLGSSFSKGLFVVQDGFNDPAVIADTQIGLRNVSTNFKYVPWETIAQTFTPPLIIDTEGYNPRKP